MKRLTAVTTIVLLATVGISTAEQNASQDNDSSAEVKQNVEFGRELTQKIQVGVKVTAGGPCRGMFITVPVPQEWPEQKVRMLEEDFSNNVVKVDYRVLENSVKQMMVSIPRLGAGEESHALVTFEIKGRAVIGPSETNELTAPKNAGKDIRKFLAASPLIESRNRKIQNEVKKLVKDKETDWQKIEAIYDFVRESVTYRESELKGAVQALNDGEGDCEAMTSLFIAMCRAAKVPARMVWVTDHCYPEFYLEDAEENGQWYPCQVAGTRSFGSMPDIRPILQKGDNIRVPEKRGGQRYAALFLKAKAVQRPNPKVTEVMEFINE
jgi:hypothetical protein